MRNKIDVAREFIFPLIVIAIIISRRKNEFFKDMLFPFYMPLTLIGLLRKLLCDIVLEKSDRFKEMLKIMGLKTSAHTFSWLLSFYIVGIFIELVVLIVLYFGEIIDETKDIGQVIGAYILYLLSSVHMAFCIATPFSIARSALKVGSSLLGLCCFIYFPLTYADSVPVSLLYIFSFIPQPGLAFSIMSLQPGSRLDGIYDINAGLIIQAINVLLYLLLYLYLDQVVKNEYGFKKSYCFCLKRSKKITRLNQQILQQQQDQLQTKNNNNNDNQISQQQQTFVALQQKDQQSSNAQQNSQFNNINNNNKELALNDQIFQDIDNLSLPDERSYAHNLPQTMNSSMKNMIQKNSQINDLQEKVSPEEKFVVVDNNNKNTNDNKPKDPAINIDFQNKLDLQNQEDNKQNNVLTVKESVEMQQVNNENNAIIIKNLCKKFGNLVAVNNLTLSLKRGEIFCLLGHNGAGKTTTISLLTGLIMKDSGDINIGQFDIDYDIDKIREHIGFCPQYDILYDFLTVKETLEMISNVRGLKEEQIENQITSLLQKYQIEQYKNKFTKDLSLGNKRRLSLCIAMLGRSDIIFLDEPTSGMDPQMRRDVWQILKSMVSKGKTIVLTTHHLDEAEILANRIGILQKGKLAVLGTPDSIKRDFGVGYVLQLSSKIDEKGQKLINMAQKQNELIQAIQNIIPEAKIQEEHINKEFFNVMLPFQSQSLFKDLFLYLEDQQNINFSLEMNSLEDAYINLEKQEENSQMQNVQQDTQEKINQKYDYLLEEIKKTTGFFRRNNRFGRQILAVITRRYLMMKRDPASSMMVIIMHFLSLVWAILFSRFYTDRDDADNHNNEAERLQLIGKAILVPFLILSSQFLTHLCIEKETQIKHMLLIMGLLRRVYWFGNLVFDLGICTISYIIMTILSIEFSILWDRWGELTLMYIGFVFSVISLAYTISFLFRTFHGAVHMWPVIIMMTYAVPYVLDFFIKYEGYQNDKDLGIQSQHIIEYVFLMFCPLYTFERGISMLNGVNNFDYVLPNCYVVFVILMLQALFFFIFLLIMEFTKFYKRDKVCKQLENQEEEQRKRLRQLFIDHESLVKECTSLEIDKQIVRVKNLTKYYEDGFRALHGISFGIEESSIFGLLGPNGAGKTTTFNLLTGLISKTKGHISYFMKYIDYKTRKNQNAQLNIGVCPSNNPLWDNLNLIEHMYIYGKIKGLTDQEIQNYTDFCVISLNMEQYQNTKVSQLSGGNKRKILVSLSLVGGPKIAFYDEPSTGVDPVSRRLLWKLMKVIFEINKSAVLLTTHQMAEAEFLSNKIGILANGSFVCINDLAQLKRKYGDGYKIQIKINPLLQLPEQTEAIIRTKFVKLLRMPSDQTNYLTFKLDLGEAKFSKLFEVLNGLKDLQNIEDFSISYITLEHVFLLIAKQQKQNGLI